MDQLIVRIETRQIISTRPLTVWWRVTTERQIGIIRASILFYRRHFYHRLDVSNFRRDGLIQSFFASPPIIWLLHSYSPIKVFLSLQLSRIFQNEGRIYLPSFWKRHPALFIMLAKSFKVYNSSLSKKTLVSFSCFLNVCAGHQEQHVSGRRCPACCIIYLFRERERTIGLFPNAP